MNKDQRPHDYAETDLYPRPSHADYTYLAKYGVKASSGGGRSSARETIGRVAAGAIAEKYLKEAYGVEIVAFVTSVGKVKIPFLEADEEEGPLGKEYVELINKSPGKKSTLNSRGVPMWRRPRGWRRPSERPSPRTIPSEGPSPV